MLYHANVSSFSIFRGTFRPVQSSVIARDPHRAGISSFGDGNRDGPPYTPPPCISHESQSFNHSNNATGMILTDLNHDEYYVNQQQLQTQNYPNELKKVVRIIPVAVLMRMFVVEPRYIPSLSMFPTFNVGDQLLVEKVGKYFRPFRRRDVVVFRPPALYVEMTKNTGALIKRIVAIGGDRVEVKNHQLYINDVLQKEDYVNDLPNYDLEKILVPDGYVLVLGDNRNLSFDSHNWGFLKVDHIIGRAVVKYWPPWRARFVEGSN